MPTKPPAQTPIRFSMAALGMNLAITTHIQDNKKGKSQRLFPFWIKLLF